MDRPARAAVLLLSATALLGCPGGHTAPAPKETGIPIPDFGPEPDGPADARDGDVSDAPPLEGSPAEAPQPDAPPPDAPPPDAAPPSFTDVPTTHTFFKEISWVAQQGIMTGCTVTTFCPDDPLSRAQAAVTLVRMKHGSTYSYDPTPHFGDVSATHWAFKQIQRLYEDGVTSGCGAGNFCPDDDTKRDEAAVFLIRAKYGASFSYSQTPYFADVPATHWAFSYVQRTHEDNLTDGCGSGNYCPDDAMLREHWAVFLYRAKTL